jgi:predicted transcriptional regulator
MWVVDDLGHTVFDSRTDKICNAIDLELTLGEEPERLTLPQWNFYLEDGCRAQPGTYTVIAEVPEHGLVSSQHIEFASMEANPCAEASSAEFAASMTWSDDTTMRIASLISSDSNEYLRMAHPCTFEVEFLNAADEVVHRVQTLCDAYDGRKILLPSNDEPLQFDPLDISLVQDGEALIPDGQYTLQLTVLSTTSATTTLPFSWPQDFSETVAEEASETMAAEQFELLGTWTGLTTDQGLCYVMDNDGEIHLLSNARTLPSWAPNSEVQGLYVVTAADPSPACASFLAPSVEVVEVRMEETVVVEEEPTVAAPVEDVATVSQSTPVIAVVSVVVTASLLSLFVVAASTNEALRLPATMAGLWFLGLLGKTHETTDGRYQRGRLMGYLTANPGCHFRALMSALEMSNGQITHHLRVLEAEENVWRKNDGRLVRFYPLTNQLHPNTREEDLPVPPLSPDPNSLQGKILNLLDQDGGLGQFPTQAELAKRLEKSQQLISHHLRTLQKFGLVERRKMGVKNRYKLTREAIFLLETSGDFAHEDAL